MAKRHRKNENRKPVLETKVDVTANGTKSGAERTYQVDLIVYSNAGDKISGKMKVGGKSIRFVWKKSKYPAPWVGVKKGEDWRKAQTFAAKVMGAWASDVLSDEGGVTQGASAGPDPDYVSQLINAGHVRRPCVVHHGNRTYLRKGTVVNEEKLSEDDCKAAKNIVRTWNALMELYKDQHGDPVNFGQWFEAEYNK